MKEVPRFNKAPNSETTKRKKLALREALLAAGIFLGGEDANAQMRSDAWRPVVSKEHDTPKLVQRPVEQFRKMSAEYVEGRLADLQMRLAPGGEYYENLNDENLSTERLAQIIDHISSVSGMFAQVRAGVIPKNKSISKYFLGTRYPGQRPYPLTMKDGRKGQCNGAYIQEQSDVFFVTAQHCLEGTTDEDKFFFLPRHAGPDVAIRKIPKSEEPPDAMVLDKRLTTEKIHGTVAIMDTIDRYGNHVVFHSIYVRMTEPVARILLRDSTPVEIAKAMANGFWYVAPPQQGDRATAGDGFNFQGESGNLNFAFVPDMGGHAIAGTFHTGTARVAECEGKTTGLCTTILFNDTPDTLRMLIGMYRAMSTPKQNENRRPEIGDPWQARVKKAR